MASITIRAGHKNLLFAALVANETGAEFEETGTWITISDSPELVIPHYCFRQTFDLDGRRDSAQLDSTWRSLLLNKQGYLVRFDDSEIVVADEKPRDRRPSFLLRFPDRAAKAQAEEWAERAGFTSTTDFVLEAVERYCRFWEDRAAGTG